MGSLRAQELKATSFEVSSSDLIARTKQVKANNGMPCAVVRVHLPLRDVDFDREWVMGEPTYDHGVYTLYMPEGARRLIIKHDNFHPLEVDFKKINPDAHTLKGLTTYVLVIQVPEGYRQPEITITTGSESLKGEVAPSGGSVAAVSSKEAAGSLPATQFYVQPTFQLGSVMAGGLALGGYVSNINFELSYLFGFSKSEELFWNNKTTGESLSETVSPSSFSFRAGYGINVAKAIRLTPQVGVGSVMVSGEQSSGYCVTASVALRAEYHISKNFGVSLTPALDFAVSKSDVFTRLSDVSSAVKGWGGGFVACLGAFLCF